MSENTFPKGGEFLLKQIGTWRIFIPEDFTEEQKMMADEAAKFIDKEVLTCIDEIESDEKRIPLNIELMKKAGELGLLGIDMPEEYNGLNMGFKTAIYVTEKTAHAASFAVSLASHTGIGMLPILFFGTEAQKQKYLSLLSTGEKLGAFALTEASSGSDALSAKTKAVLSEDGKYYILNGEKMWITNAGFADIFILYAQVDGNKFTAFIVEKDFEGFSTGAEEHKLGIKGSSTRTLILDNVKVPVENVLGEVGKGHKSALGILNMGRVKLGIGALGSAKYILGLTAKYANERKQFGMPISSFGMIRRKFADMMFSLYPFESMAYRTADLIDKTLHSVDSKSPDYTKIISKILEEYDIESSIIKVYGSELLDFIADHCVQIYGGYGYSEEYPVARAYRDSRINRIFEGTNEINRLTIIGTILKRTMKGELDLMTSLNEVLAEIKEDKINKTPSEGPLGNEITSVEIAKKLFIYTAGCIVQKYMAELQDKVFTFTKGEYSFEDLANMVISIYAMESAILRTSQLIEKQGEEKTKIPLIITKAFVYTELDKMFKMAKLLLADVADGNGDNFKRYDKALQRLYYFTPFDLQSARDTVASHLLEYQSYVL